MLTMILPLFIRNIGATELIILVVLLLLLFGGKKIPELMRGMGRGVKEFKDAVNKDYNGEEGVEEADAAAPERSPGQADKKTAAKSTSAKGASAKQASGTAAAGKKSSSK